MDEHSFTVQLTCPHCGFINKWRNQTASQPHSGLTYCDEEEGGCGAKFAFEYTVPQFITAQTYKLVPIV